MKTLYIYDDYYLPYLFPEHIITEDLSAVSPSRNVILKVRRENLALPLQEYPSLIMKYGYSKLGLTYTILDRKTLIEFLIQTRGYANLKKLEKFTEKAEDEDFKRFIILSLALGKWSVEADEAEPKIYQLFEALFESKVKFLAMYFEFRKSSSFPELWSAVLTFLTKARRYESQVGPLTTFYARLLKSMNQQGSFKHFVELFQTEKPSEHVVIGALLEVK